MKEMTGTMSRMIKTIRTKIFNVLNGGSMLLLEDKRVLPLLIDYRPSDNYISYRDDKGILRSAPVTWRNDRKGDL